MDLTNFRFFYGWNVWEKRLYGLFVVAHILYGMSYVAWTGWMEPNVKPVQDMFQAATVGQTPVSILVTRKYVGQIIYYGVAAFNIVPLFFNQWIGFLNGGNKLGIASSVVGFIMNGFLVLYGAFDYIMNCNKDGHPGNICTNTRYTCQNPTQGNGCTNTYNCPTPIANPGWNTEFAFLYWFAVYWFFYNLACVIYSIWIQVTVKYKIKQPNDKEVLAGRLLQKKNDETTDKTE